MNYRANNLVDSCGARGSKELAAALKKAIEAQDLPITLETVHCIYIPLNVLRNVLKMQDAMK